MINKRIPLKASTSVIISAGSSGVEFINIPYYERWFIKSWTVTAGANTTVECIMLDENDTYEVDSIADTVTRYGATLSAISTVGILGSNAGGEEETLTLEITGYKLI
jgi:hypothetical protein